MRYGLDLATPPHMWRCRYARETPCNNSKRFRHNAPVTTITRQVGRRSDVEPRAYLSSTSRHPLPPRHTRPAAVDTHVLHTFGRPVRCVRRGASVAAHRVAARGVGNAASSPRVPMAPWASIALPTLPRGPAASAIKTPSKVDQNRSAFLHF